MKYSENYGFNLPSRDDEDIADINQISENFVEIDGILKDAENRADQLEENAQNGFYEVDIKIDSEVKRVNNNFANALKKKVYGSVAVAKDVSPIEHDIEINVEANEKVFVQDVYTDHPVVESSGVVTPCYGTAKKEVKAGETYFIYVNGVQHELIAWNKIDFSEGQVAIGYIDYIETDEVGGNDPSIPIGLMFNGSGSYEFYMYETVDAETIDIDLKVYQETSLDGVVLNRYGKNIFNKTTPYEVTFTASSGGTKRTAYGYNIALPNGTYTVSATPSGETAEEAYLYIRTNNSDGDWLQSHSLVADKTIKNFTVTVNDGDVIFLYDALLAGEEKAKNEFLKYNIQIEVGNTATEYNPYEVPEVFDVPEDGVVKMKSVYPVFTIVPNRELVSFGFEYNRDLVAVIEKLESVLYSQSAVATLEEL